LLLLGGLAYGQSIPPASSALQLGYSGELGFHPGLQIGYEWAIKDWRKTRKNGKVRQKSLVPHASLSHIWLIDTRSSTFIEGGAYYRTLKPSGWTRQWSLRLGAAYLENAGTTYVEQEDGSSESFQFIGRTYATLSLGHGWGYDFRAQQDLALAVYLQPQASLLFGYNGQALPFIRLEAGVRYYLGSQARS
ncbi:MAG: hypothetical protein AAFP02_22000, partial [Bacteroidota bacterium]